MAIPESGTEKRRKREVGNEIKKKMCVDNIHGQDQYGFYDVNNNIHTPSEKIYF